MTKAEYQKTLSNLKGTLAIEDIELSEETLRNLRRIADGEDYRMVLQEIKDKYTKHKECKS